MSDQKVDFTISGRYQPKSLVLTFSHAHQAARVGDIQVRGYEHANRYYHIITPLKNETCVMYRYRLEGYAYGCSKPLDIIWCGYTYIKGLTHCCATELHNIGVNVTQYISGSNRVVLKFGPISRYCNAFELYYAAHYNNVQMGLKLNEYEIIVTKEDGKI